MRGDNSSSACLAKVCFITGGANVEGTVLRLLECGLRWIQYREKGKSRREMFYEALRLKALTKRFEACLIINDYADIALAVGAEGLHLGQDDLPLGEARRIMGGRIIGISTHTIEEAREAERGGADYIGFGPIFPTKTKDAGLPKGSDSLREIRKAVAIPVIAIGGIKADNAAEVFDAGCDGVAVSSGLSEGNVAENARRFFMSCRDRDSH